MFCDPAMADTTQRRRISAAYLWPILRVERTLSFPGNQLPRLPTMKGWTVTSEYFWRSCCRSGSYFCTLWATASSSAVGEPSNGQETSTSVTFVPHGEMMVKSGLLSPVVPGRGCSFVFVPKKSGTALTILSRMALCLSRAMPRL